MFGWKTLIMIALPMLRMAGEAKKAEDTNDTGTDDLIGVSLVYAADLLDAILRGKSVPKAPEALK